MAKTPSKQDGVLIHHTDWGAGPTLVFAHAWGLNSQMWSRQVSTLVDRGFRCVTIDRRGHGRSELATTGYDLDTLATDIHSVVEALDLRDVTVIGHSMGAAEVVRTVGMFGADRLRSAVLSAPVTPMLMRSEDNPAGLDPALLAASSELMRHDLAAWLEQGSAGYFGDVEADRLAHDWTRNTIFAQDMQVLAETSQAFGTADLRADVAAIPVPTLVIQGDRDLSAPIEVTGRPTLALLRDGRLHEVRGGGHGIYYAHAVEYNRVIAEFASQ